MSVAYQSWKVVSGPAMGLNMPPQGNLCGYLVGKTRVPDEANASQETVIQGMSSLSLLMPAQFEGESCSENCRFNTSCSLSSKCLEMNSTSIITGDIATSHVPIDGVSQSPQFVTQAMLASPAFEPQLSSSFMGVEKKSLPNPSIGGVKHTMPSCSATSAQSAQLEDQLSVRARNSIIPQKSSSLECSIAGSSFNSFCHGSKYTLGVVAEDKPWEDTPAMTNEDVELDTLSTSSSSSFSCSDDSPVQDSLSADGRGDGEVQSAYNGLSSLSGGLSPARKGLSRFYAGKSRSFSCLGDVMSVKDLAKPENPYSKKRKCNLGRSMNASSRTQLPPLQKGTACISKKPLHSGKSTLALAMVMSAREGATVAEDKQNKDLGEVHKWPLPSRSYSLSDLQGSERELSGLSCFH